MPIFARVHPGPGAAEVDRPVRKIRFWLGFLRVAFVTLCFVNAMGYAARTYAAEKGITSADKALFDEHASPFTNMPDALFDLLARYAKTDKFHRCGHAVGTLLGADQQPNLKNYWDAASSRTALQKLYEDYSTDCLISLDDLTLPTAPHNYRDELRTYVARSGMFFVNLSGVREPFCAGIRLKGNQVLTAKHCFYRADEWVAERARWPIDQRSDSEIGVEVHVLTCH